MKQDTKEIIKRIAGIQLSALLNIESDWENVDKELLGKYLGISEDLKQSLYDHIGIYQDLMEFPSTINMLNEYQLLVCSHILFRMEDEWIQIYSEGVQECWQMLFKSVNRIHPEYNLIWAYERERIS